MPSLVFPFLCRAIKRFAQKNEIESQYFYHTSQTVLPLAFTFGQLGNFFILFFIYFLSFYTHQALTSAQQFTLMALLLPISFGTVFTGNSSISFLIDKFHFSEEASRVFETISSVTKNFQALLSVASVLTLVILILSAYYGLLKVRWKKLIQRLLIAFGFFALLIAITKPFIKFQDNFTYLYGSLRISDILDHPVNSTIFQPGQSVPPSAYPSLPPLQRVLKSGVLRVGYYFMDTPFCYFNRFGELAGYDVAFAYQLAKDLDCSLEFIPIDTSRLGEQLTTGEFDVGMSAIIMTEERLTQMDFVKPNFEQNNVLIVPVRQKQQFLNLDDVVARKGLKIGGIGGYFDTLARHFPLAQHVSLHNFRGLMDGEVDAVLWSYLSAFVWCLSHPQFTIVDYQGRLGKHFSSYAVPETSYEWGHFLQNWMILKDESRFSAMMYDYWILGHLPEAQHPRWSILRNGP
jgi:proton glutamate symport protein